MSYNLYFSITKEDFKNPIPDSLQGKYSRIVEDTQGESSIEVASSWEQAAEWGMFPWVRECIDWDTQGMDNALKVAIVKDEFSFLSGEVSALISLGEGKIFPYNSILTKSEAQALAGSELFTSNE